MLSDMHRTMCNGKPGLCDAMKPTKGADLLKYLRKVNFTGTDHMQINILSKFYIFCCNIQALAAIDFTSMATATDQHATTLSTSSRRLRGTIAG